jgi:hypothetical protein
MSTQSPVARKQTHAKIFEYPHTARLAFGRRYPQPVTLANLSPALHTKLTDQVVAPPDLGLHVK